MVNALAALPPFFLLVFASSHLKRDMRLHERRDGVPEGFTSKGPAPGNATLPLRLALVQNDIEGLQTKLMDVSTPRSPQYGRWLSKEEVGAFVTPKLETLTAVNEWLAGNGLKATVLSPYGDWIGFKTTVSHANVLFDADFSTFVHDGSGRSTIRTLAYSIPASLKDHLQLVHPTITFPATNNIGPIVHSSAKNMVNRSTTSAVAPTLCDVEMTPKCIQQLYKIPRTPASHSSNKLVVSGFIQEFADRADLRKFLQTFRADLPPSNTFTLQTIDGGTNPQTPNKAGLEASVDVQYTIGLASGVPTSFISVGNQFQDGDLNGFLDIINFLSGDSAPPKVLTTSYGMIENTISRKLAHTLCNAYASLGARGVSILFSSGDGGVSGSKNAQCTTFVPTFPSSCPYVTSVGATQNVNPETSAPYSSGGFSNYFDTPSYQTAAKKAYLAKLGSDHAGRFNTTGRGIPDVAAVGTNIPVVLQGSVVDAFGTSCSSPVFASVISLLNDRLIGAGKPALGFLNPFLYSTGAKALNDITTGSNPGCNTNGFPAEAGWDPVTGLGTPNWDKLLAAVGL